MLNHDPNASLTSSHKPGGGHSLAHRRASSAPSIAPRSPRPQLRILTSFPPGDLDQPVPVCHESLSQAFIAAPIDPPKRKIGGRDTHREMVVYLASEGEGNISSSTGKSVIDQLAGISTEERQSVEKRRLSDRVSSFVTFRCPSLFSINKPGKETSSHPATAKPIVPSRPYRSPGTASFMVHGQSPTPPHTVYLETFFASPSSPAPMSVAKGSQSSSRLSLKADLGALDATTYMARIVHPGTIREEGLGAASNADSLDACIEL